MGILIYNLLSNLISIFQSQPLYPWKFKTKVTFDMMLSYLHKYFKLSYHNIGLRSYNLRTSIHRCQHHCFLWIYYNSTTDTYTISITLQDVALLLYHETFIHKISSLYFHTKIAQNKCTITYVCSSSWTFSFDKRKMSVFVLMAIAKGWPDFMFWGSGGEASLR